MIASKRANQARIITKELVKETESAISDEIKVEELPAQEAMAPREQYGQEGGQIEKQLDLN